MSDEMCRHCGGHNGAHGLVHVRYGNGGGGNQPCPASAEPSKRLDWPEARANWLRNRAADSSTGSDS